jgi:hypothetical protein
MLCEYLTLFWFAIVNEYKLEYGLIQKSLKDEKFGQCLYVMSRTDENIWAMFICYLLRAELMRRTDLTWSLTYN